MVTELDQRVQRERYFAIVDEVDNILIDEARTPLIISGQAEESADLYFTFARLVPAPQGPPRGRRGGRRLLRRPQGPGRLARPRRASTRSSSCSASRTCTTPTRAWPATSSRRCKAHALYKRDRDYIVKDGEIVIVDEFTGRLMPGRRWTEGLHQAIEAKEGLRVQREKRDARHDHVPELLPPVRQAGRHDRHGDDRGGGVPQDLQARGRRRSRPTGR